MTKKQDKMSNPPEFDPLQFEFIKDTIPFVADDIADLSDYADFELDFSIVDIDEYSESETEEVAQNFLAQSEIRLSNINRHLTAWRTNGVNEDILAGIRSEFQSLEYSAASAEFEDISRLSQVVASLLGQGLLGQGLLGQGKPISDDSSLLNLLEEMHDGLAAELGFSGKASETHLRSLIGMVQLLIADKLSPTSMVTSDAPDEQYDVSIEPPKMTEYQDAGAGAGELAEQVTVSALLVTVGRYRVALLIRAIDRVMRVHEDEMQLPTGQHLDEQPCVVLESIPTPIVNLSTCLGEAHIRVENSARFLVIIRPQDGLVADDIVADKMIAVEVDRFQEVADIVIQSADSPLPSNTGVVGVATLTDDSLVLVLDVKQFVAQEGFQVWRHFYDHERQSADSHVETNKSVESYRD